MSTMTSTALQDAVQIARKKNITRAAKKIRELIFSGPEYLRGNPEQIELVAEQIHDMGEKVGQRRALGKNN